MKHRSAITIILLLLISRASTAQQVDSIFFHLYTDSLKKGTYNYINVDGKTDSGGWMPLTAKHIYLTCSAGKFEGNSLVLDKDFAEDSVAITASLKSDTLVKKTVTIYVKKMGDNEKLKTKEEIFREARTHGKGKN